MHQRISKKIFIYFFIFFILGTLNNKNLINIDLKNKIQIKNESKFENNKIIKDLSALKDKNLFLLNKKEVLEIIDSHYIVEEFLAFKNYPFNLNVKINNTKFLAITKKDGFDFYIGSNGKLIKVENKQLDLPFVFGKINIEDFLNLKKIIDNSDFDFNDVQNLYYFKSKRWDIETKNGILINLPPEKIDKSFEILLNFLKKKDFKNYKNIDLRQANQIILNGKYK